VILVVLALLGAWSANLIWGKPGNIDHFFERTFIRQALASPEFLTHIGLLEPYGIDFHNSKLDDPSEAFALEQVKRVKSELAILRSYDRASLTPSQQLSSDIAEYFLDTLAQGEPWRMYNYPVNQLFGAQSEKPAFMMNIHPVRSVADAGRYNDRLEAFAPYFDTLLVELENRERRGIAPPRFVVEKVLVQMRGFIAPVPREHPLYTTLRDKLAKVPGSDNASADILRRTEAAIERSVHPAYRRLIAYHEGLLARTTTDDGVWKLPDGERYYAYMLRRNTTTDLTPEAIHQTGLREVARIEAEIEAALASAGLKEGTIKARMDALTRDPRQSYPDNSPQTRERVIADYNAILEEIDRRIDTAFSIRPKSGFEVRAVEPFREKTSAGAFYSQGTLDGTRKGIFYVNTRDIPAEIPKFSMKTLAYHEAIPGHYFQGAIAQQMTGVPTFRRVIPFTAYQEGWGLYSEKLAWELGLYKDDPYGNIGRLRDEMLRATRLVVDTGIHHKRWTREKAIAYMLEKTGSSEGEITAEVERYIVSPGQACAYKVGELKILELRERARHQLGARFDIRRFHAVVLENGSVPLALLERLVDDFIRQESRRGAV
jgi:uncharacterized protein (DUF885 family)